MRRTPAKGAGFELSWHEGHVVESYFTLDGEKHGLHRHYFRGQASLAEESTFVRGVPHGRARTFREPGVIESDVVWDDGLPRPVVR